MVSETASYMFCGLVAFTPHSQGCDWESGLHFFIFKGLLAFFKEPNFPYWSLFASTQNVSHFRHSSALLFYSPQVHAAPLSIHSLARQVKKCQNFDLATNFCTKMLHNKVDWVDLYFFCDVSTSLTLLSSLEFRDMKNAVIGNNKQKANLIVLGAVPRYVCYHPLFYHSC